MDDCEHGLPAWAVCEQCIVDAVDKMAEEISRANRFIVDNYDCPFASGGIELTPCGSCLYCELMEKFSDD